MLFSWKFLRVLAQFCHLSWFFFLGCCYAPSQPCPPVLKSIPLTRLVCVQCFPLSFLLMLLIDSAFPEYLWFYSSVSIYMAPFLSVCSNPHSRVLSISSTPVTFLSGSWVDFLMSFNVSLKSSNGPWLVFKVRLWYLFLEFHLFYYLCFLVLRRHFVKCHCALLAPGFCSLCVMYAVVRICKT